MPIDIPGFDGVYKIDEDGNVFNRYNRIMKPGIDKKGYARIELWYHKYLVHRLVADTLLANPENKPEVNHIDSNKSNNKLSNLEWVTHAQNQQRMKHYKTDSGEHHISTTHKGGFQGGFMKDGKAYRFFAATLEEAIQKRDALQKKLYG